MTKTEKKMHIIKKYQINREDSDEDLSDKSEEQDDPDFSSLIYDETPEFKMDFSTKKMTKDEKIDKVLENERLEK